MTFTALHGAAAGAIVTGALVAFALHPAALAPHASPTPSLDAARADSPLRDRDRAAPRATPASAIVYVAGAVAHPGVYALASDARAEDAVAKAGGFTHDADTVAVNLAAHVADGDEIAVPHLGDAPASSSTHHRTSGRASKHARRGHRRRTPRTDEAPSQTIDLNTADESALEAIPGIGPTLATRIVEFREVNGPFPTVDALADVSGITPAKFDTMAPFLTVGRP